MTNKASLKPNNPKPHGKDVRGELINWRLEYMSNMASALKSSGWNEIEKANENKYIRINGESYRAVSLADESPLCQYHISKSTVLSSVIGHFANSPEPLDPSLLVIKKERRLQSLIIRQALLNNRNLLDESLFGKALEGDFDKLTFALDEVSFGDKNNKPTIRCDILAVGQKGDEIFPVVIELKSERSLGRLIEQLDNACVVINAHHDNFRVLLKGLTGMSISKSVDTKRILVWPKGNNRKDTIKKMSNSIISFVDYSLDSKKSPDDVIFSKSMSK